MSSKILWQFAWAIMAIAFSVSQAKLHAVEKMCYSQQHVGRPQ